MVFSMIEWFRCVHFCVLSGAVAVIVAVLLVSLLVLAETQDSLEFIHIASSRAISLLTMTQHAFIMRVLSLYVPGTAFRL